MQGTPAVYLGRVVSKENFRAYIYSPNGSKKLIESWPEFETHMQSGVWFATPESAKVVTEEKPKQKRAPRAKKELVPEEADEVHVDDDKLAFEVNAKNDFLPKG